MKIRKLIRTTLQQKQPVLWVGAIRDMLTRTQSYYGLLNLPLLMVTVFSLRMDLVHRYLPWLTLPILLGLVVLGLIIINIIDWKWIYPSVIAHHQHQAWKHRSQARENFEAQRKRLDNLYDVLEEMRNDIKEIKGKLS